MNSNRESLGDERDVRATVQSYVDAWNEPDETNRRRLLERSWAEAGTYTDPSVHVEGREALVHHAGTFGSRWPGARIVVTGGIAQHHEMLLFTWRVAGPDGATLREGVDFAEMAEDGRLRRVVGFFDSLPKSP
jgi:hypothetical protein